MKKNENKNEKRKPKQDTCDVIFNLANNLYTVGAIVVCYYLSADGDASQDDLFSDIVVDYDKAETSADKAWWAARKLYTAMCDEWDVDHVENPYTKFKSAKKWPESGKDLAPFANGRLAEYLDSQIQQLNLIRASGHECDAELFSELYDQLEALRRNVR